MKNNRIKWLKIIQVIFICASLLCMLYLIVNFFLNINILNRIPNRDMSVAVVFTTLIFPLFYDISLVLSTIISAFLVNCLINNQEQIDILSQKITHQNTANYTIVNTKTAPAQKDNQPENKEATVVKNHVIAKRSSKDNLNVILVDCEITTDDLTFFCPYCGAENRCCFAYCRKCGRDVIYKEEPTPAQNDN